MTSNSEKMTLEERLVQRIKDDTLGGLIGDEDAILDLTRRAVREALFKDRVVTIDRWNEKREMAPAVASAWEIAKAAADAVVKAEIERLTADPEFMKAVREAMARAFPEAIAGTLSGMVYSLRQQTVNEGFAHLQERIRQNGGVIPT